METFLRLGRTVTPLDPQICKRQSYLQVSGGMHVERQCSSIRRIFNGEREQHGNNGDVCGTLD